MKTALCLVTSFWLMACAASGGGGDGGGDDDDGSGADCYTMAPDFDTCVCQVDPRDDLKPAGICREDNPRNSICCADEGYPASGTRCSCSRWGCDTTNGCLCSSANGQLENPITACGAGTDESCCSTGSTCTCSTLACGASETQVTDCSIVAAACPNEGQTQVEACD